MQIRSATEADLDDWIALRNALWPGHEPNALRTEAKQILRSASDECFLLIDGIAVGFAEVTLYSGPDGPYAHLEGWYVAPAQRGQGHGKSLVEHVELWCLHRAIGILTSDTNADYPLSPASHERCGFEKISEFTIFKKALKP